MKIDTKNFPKYIGIGVVLIILVALVLFGASILLTPQEIVSTDRSLPGAIEADSNIVTINNQEVGKKDYQAAGLAAMWHFNGDLFDSTGSGLDGKASSVTFVEGMWGKKAINFNGNGYVQVDDSMLLNFAPKQGFAISVWVKPTANNSSVILSKGDISSNKLGYGLTINPLSGASMKISDGSASVYEQGSVISSTKFHFLVYSVDHMGNCQRFVDGELVGKDFCPSLDGLDLTNTSPLYVGANFDGTKTTNNFTVSIQDLAIWRRPLSLQEVQTMYNASATN
jgi:hypothetical protein